VDLHGVEVATLLQVLDTHYDELVSVVLDKPEYLNADMDNMDYSFCASHDQCLKWEKKWSAETKKHILWFDGSIDFLAFDLDGNEMFNALSKHCHSVYIEKLTKRLDPVQAKLVHGIIDGLQAYFK
jgi:hypothetical protein